MTPEDKARKVIDQKLRESGWVVQHRTEVNLAAGPGVVIRELPLERGHGRADYLLFLDGLAVGVLEAKKLGFPLSGVEVQARKYSEGWPANLKAPYSPLPFCYLSTGAVTRFTNKLDPHPRSRRIFQFHRPETLRNWLHTRTLNEWVTALHPKGGLYTAADDSRPSTLRSRMQTLPPLEKAFLYDNQVRAVTNLEMSLKADKPRALIQMSTGSGKTLAAVTATYRLVKYAGARRVLFLVDRGNLGEQAETEFQSFRSPDDNRKFTELYNVQRLQSPTIGASSKVVIATIQRFYAMLRGEPLPDEEAEERSLFEGEANAVNKEPLPVVYNRSIPPETFDVIIIDECHRSIYSLWRQVLEYFDAYLIGLTATPAKHTFGFFEQNLVMEYGHEEAVADGVNVDFDIYQIRTQITEQGATIEADNDTMLGYRDRQTRSIRWDQPDEDVDYSASDLDRSVVAKDQIRLIVQTFRDKLSAEIFPGRTEVPKTLVFAKDDSHAEDIVEIIRQEFGRGNAFCRKITYKTTGHKPRDLIQEFRNSYQPRIAVTVDMIATGTDIKPVEVVMFMRTVKSRVLFEQMKGRGVRVIDQTDLAAVTPDAKAKTHFVIVDCVGVTNTELADTQPLERKKAISFEALLEHVALGGIDPEMLSSLASRLARFEKQCSKPELEKINEVGQGATLKTLSRDIVMALDPDRQIRKARLDNHVPENEAPTEQQVQEAGQALCKEAVTPLAINPKLRQTIVEVKKFSEQLIDEISKDALLSAGHSLQAKDRARSLVTHFKTFIEEHKAELDALQFFYAQPYKERLRYKDIKALHEAISAPPRSWTPEKLWAAYELIERNKVKGASAERRLTDIVSLIRFALKQDEELIPFSTKVAERFDHWLAQQQGSGRRFTQDQQRWLGMIRDNVAESLKMEMEDFNYTPFVNVGGLGKARQVFGQDLQPLIQELNEVLAA